MRGVVGGRMRRTVHAEASCDPQAEGIGGTVHAKASCDPQAENKYL